MRRDDWYLPAVLNCFFSSCGGPLGPPFFCRPVLRIEPQRGMSFPQNVLVTSRPPLPVEAVPDPPSSREIQVTSFFPPSTFRKRLFPCREIRSQQSKSFFFFPLIAVPFAPPSALNHTRTDFKPVFSPF